MDAQTFKGRGKQMVEYMIEYMETLKSRPVLPSVTPGYLRERLPAEAPLNAESFDQIMRDVEEHIMPGVSK